MCISVWLFTCTSVPDDMPCPGRDTLQRTILAIKGWGTEHCQLIA